VNAVYSSLRLLEEVADPMFVNLFMNHLGLLYALQFLPSAKRQFGFIKAKAI
jgi:hypothetical protein